MYKVEIRRQNTTKYKMKHGYKNVGPKQQKESNDNILLLFLVEEELDGCCTVEEDCGGAMADKDCRGATADKARLWMTTVETLGW